MMIQKEILFKEIKKETPKNEQDPAILKSEEKTPENDQDTVLSKPEENNQD